MRKRGHPPQWSEDDDLFLECSIHRLHPEDIGAKINKTLEQVQYRCRKLGYNKTTCGYTVESLAQAFGRHHDVIHRWIRTGKLKATRRNTRYQRDYWFVADESVYNFIHAYPEEIDMARVDTLWFKDASTKRGLGALTRTK